jgi:hypothetical protein
VNDNALRIKRMWLLMLFLMPVFYLVCFMFFVVQYENSIPPGLQAIIQGNVLKMVSSVNNHIFAFFGGTLINIPIMFYFSYKKQGTMLLFLAVWGGVLSTIIFVFGIPKIYPLFMMLSAFQNSVDVNAKWAVSFLRYVLFFHFSNFFITIFWSFCCYKLRLLNFEQRFNKIIASESYKNIFVALEDISELRVLDEFYGNKVREHPEIEKLLTIKYKKKKKALKLLKTN